jgi:hypothetical protein
MPSEGQGKHGHDHAHRRNGCVAHVTIADVKQSNGVIYVIDKVLLCKMWSGVIPSSERPATLESAGLFSFHR